MGPGDLTPFISSTRAHFPLKLAGLCLEHQPGTGEVVWVCSRELWVRLTQAHPAHLLKRRQLGEREVSAPRFDLFFCCQDFSTCCCSHFAKTKDQRLCISNAPH